jgi:aldehyde dehydrogenase (NAD+)
MSTLPSTAELSSRIQVLLSSLGVRQFGGDHPSRTPITGGSLADFSCASDVDRAVEMATDAFRQWRLVPAPVRGALIRRYGELLREHKNTLGELVSIESGKILSEGCGEVQEMIDICDFAVGLSRQLHGLTIASERPGHRLSETWHPLGPCGVITAFNFPVAVWSWNAMLALVCGDPVIWKPSEKTTLTALACSALLEHAMREQNAPRHLNQVLAGDAAIGAALAAHRGLPLISATGSTRMGRQVSAAIAHRLGRGILELGGNNAAIIAPSADLELTLRAVTFAAAGTAGQRCTSLRRLIVHRSRRDEVLDRLTRIFNQLAIGNPLDSAVLVGPLIDKMAFAAMSDALASAARDGGTVLAGGERLLAEQAPDAFYVRPALVSMDRQTAIVKLETFAPILYALSYDDLGEAIAMNNEVSQGLSSSIFTNELREAEQFCAADGSDCGIANVNIGPSGAEIGGAFGGEKDTGGGRESGSDAWKAYMRRATNTINYSGELPLAQGVRFDID